MKNTLRNLSLAAVAALAAATLMQAQQPPPNPPPVGEHGPRPGHDGKKAREHRMQVLEEKVQITAAQKTQILAIWDKADEQGKALRADAALAREDRRAKMMEIMKGTHDQVRALLTADQQKACDALPPEGPGRRGPCGGEGAGGPPPPPPPPQS